MAETQAEPIEQSQPEAPKRGRGRPPKSPDDPRPLQAAETPPFFDRLKTFSDTDWNERLIMYLFRRYPVTDRKLTGNDLHLMKYAKPVDAQEILERFGSGEYRLQLNEWNPQSRTTRTIENHIWKMVNMDYPPKIPVGEWLDDPRNKDWWWAKPKLMAEQEGQVRAAGATATIGEAANLFKQAVDAVKQLRPDESPDQQNSLAAQVISSMEKNADRMVEMVTSASNPGQFLGLVDKILGMSKSDGGATMQIVMAQLTALQSELAAERAFNRQLLTKEPEARRSLKEELGDVKEIASMFRGGGSAAISGTDWGGVALQLGGKLLEVGGAIAQVAMARAGQKPPARPAQTVTVAGTLPQPIAPEAPQPIQPTPEQQMFQELEMLNLQLGELLDTATPHLVDMFHKATGMHFRDWFLDEYGDFSYRVTKRLGPEKVLALFELRKQVAAPNIQQLLQQLQPPEKVQEFVLQFLSDEPAEEDEGDDDQEKPGIPEERKPVKTKDF